jgi:hypothetical protein
MRISNRQVQFGTSCLGLIAHANQVEFLLKAFGYTNHHVVYQLAHGAGHGIGFAGIIGRNKAQLACVI